MNEDAYEVARRGLAQELHDTVIQPLTSLVMSFTCFERQPMGMEHAEAGLVLWKALAQEALDSLRSALAGFPPSPHGGYGLAEAFQRSLAPQLGSRGLRVKVESRDWPTDLPPDWNRHLYLAVREALTNVEKHARASEVSIDLQADADGLVIMVMDNGVGWRQGDRARGQPARPGCGLGMASIHDHLSHLGGHLDIATAPGRGVRLNMWLPHPPRTDATPSASARGYPEAGRATSQQIH